VKGPSMASRRHLPDYIVLALCGLAENAGFCPVPVFNRAAAIHELHLFRDGGLVASLFKPPGKGFGVWRVTGSTVLAEDQREAVRLASGGGAGPLLRAA
jgi:hypothetical protein